MDLADETRGERRLALERVFDMKRHLMKDNRPTKIEDGLFLGSLQAAKNKEELKRLNITHILTVAKYINPIYPNEFVYKVINVSDKQDTDLKQYFDQCIGFIDDAKRLGGGVLVHCFVGKSRSVTIVIAYLMKKHGMSMYQALDHVKSKRPKASPNSGFLSQLQDFEISLLDRTQKRPKLTRAPLQHVLQIATLPNKERDMNFLLTAENFRQYGFFIDLSIPECRPAIPPTLSQAMEFKLLGEKGGDKKEKKRKEKDADVRAKKDEGSSKLEDHKQKDARMMAQETPSLRTEMLRLPQDLDQSKVVEIEDSTFVQRPGKGIQTAQHLAVPLDLRQATLLPGTHVLDPNFQIPDVPDDVVSRILKLPERFSLPFQAIYDSFFDKDWKAIEKMPILDRQREQIRQQVAALELSVANYIELEALCKRDGEASKVQENLQARINSLRTTKNEAKEQLEVEEAKVRSLQARVEQLEKGLEEKKEELLAQGQEEGTRQAVRNFLNSEEFSRKKESIIEEFLASEEIGRKKDEFINFFKSYPEFKTLQLKLMEEVGNQVITHINRKCPEFDTGFLDEELEEEDEERASRGGVEE